MCDYCAWFTFRRVCDVWLVCYNVSSFVTVNKLVYVDTNVIATNVDEYHTEHG